MLRLLPLYEDIEDGAEILWHDHGAMTVAKIKDLIKSKRQLPVFDGSEVEGDRVGATISAS